MRTSRSPRRLSDVKAKLWTANVKLDEGINESPLDYIARREREIPVVNELNTEH